MMKAKSITLLASLSLLGAFSCSGNSSPASSSSPAEGSPSTQEITTVEESVPQEDNAPVVFVLTGQSNMEGQTKWHGSTSKGDSTDHPLLQEAMEALSQDPANGVDPADYDLLAGEGIANVRTSYYGCGYGQIYTPSNIHASNKETPINGKFENTKVGMGSADDRMGPELGAAYRLKDRIGEKKVYFIKAGISGSGFAQNDSLGDKINWNVEKEENLYVNHLKPYTDNCLRLIEEETGVKPVMRGFLWMQGESDSDENKIPYYAERTNALFGKFQEDYKNYARNGDKDTISFIDALIYDADDTSWGVANSRNLNQVKLDNAAAHPNYYCVNSSCYFEGGLALKTGSPGGDSMHYCTESSFRLGLAYADIILDNNLL